MDEIKKVELMPQEEDLNSNKSVDGNNEAGQVDPQDLLDMLLAAKAGYEGDPLSIADLQSEDSEEAGQD